MSNGRENKKTKLTVAVILTEFAVIAVLLVYMFSGGLNKDNAKNPSKNPSTLALAGENTETAAEQITQKPAEDNKEELEAAARKEALMKVAADMEELSKKNWRS